jgi:hypothetical protein
MSERNHVKRIGRVLVVGACACLIGLAVTPPDSSQAMPYYCPSWLQGNNGLYPPGPTAALGYCSYGTGSYQIRVNCSSARYGRYSLWGPRKTPVSWYPNYSYAFCNRGPHDVAVSHHLFRYAR